MKKTSRAFMQAWTCKSISKMAGQGAMRGITVTGWRAALNAGARRLPTGVIYGAGLLPVPMLLINAQSGALGPEPIKALEHALGTYALQFLIAGLLITPLRRWAGVSLLKFRRALGLLAFAYVCLHLLVWLVLDIGSLGRIGADIVKRPYITVGMLGFVLLVPLAVTSNRWALRRLGGLWHKLHRLAYAVIALAGLHYLMIQKVYDVQALIYAGLVVFVLALRLPQLVRAGKPG